MSDLLIVGLVFLVCGLFQMMLVPSAAWYIWRLRRRGLHTTGTVLDHIADPSTVVRMGAEFVDQHGQNVSLVTDRLNTPYTGVFAVGQKLDILYLPARPTDARPAKMPLPKPPRRNLHARYVSLLLVLTKIMQRFFRFVNPRGKYGLKEEVAEYSLRRQLRKHGIRTQATVTWQEHSERSKSRRPVMCPLIGYVDQDGQATTFRAVGRPSNLLPPIGREIPVIYLPKSSSTYPHPLAAPYAVIPADMPSSTRLLVAFLNSVVAIVIGVLLILKSLHHS